MQTLKKSVCFSDTNFYISLLCSARFSPYFTRVAQKLGRNSVILRFQSKLYYHHNHNVLSKRDERDDRRDEL